MTARGLPFGRALVVETRLPVAPGAGRPLNGSVDLGAVLAAFDEQLRRTPRGDFERAGAVVRSAGDWAGIDWAEIDERTADAVIAEQVRYFTGLGREFEWKYYGHDLPADLPERLLRAGFEPGPEESLMVAEVDAVPRADPPPGVELVAVTGAEGVRELVAVHEEVFGESYAEFGRWLLDRVRRSPGAVVPVLAMSGGTAVCGARIDFHPGTDFASLWGGGTREAWRGKGIYRAMVSYRAALARRGGFRYLRVDALPASRPILERSGFVRLSTTIPFVSRRGKD